MKNRLSYLLFLSIIFFGIIVTISAKNIITIWLGLEINIIAFLPLIIHSNDPISSTNLIKYFLIQAITSFLILFSFICDITFTSHIVSWNLITICALIIKMGIAPYHFWLPSIIRGLNWTNCFILTVIQKIAPLILCRCGAQINTPIFALLFISLATRSVGGIKQTRFRPILAYSSIHHIVWCILGMLHGTPLFLAYFIFYSVSCFILFLFLNKYHADGFVISSPNYWSPTYLIPIITILSIAGLPPLLGFFPKLFVLQRVISTSLVLSFLLILRSSLNILFYIKFAYSFITDKFSKIQKTNTRSSTLFGISIYSFAHLPVLIIFLIYALNILH